MVTRSGVTVVVASSAEWIHKPWEAPTNALTTAGVELGVTYPDPVVNHPSARIRALAALTKLRKGQPYKS